MDHRYPVKEDFAEYVSSNSGILAAAPPPMPIEGLNDPGPPPFVIKTYDMVDDPSTNIIVSWSIGGQSFVVWDAHDFSTSLLPSFFKHSNFSSFVRQLNTYGFRKIDPERWEFANELFLKGQKYLLKNIRRKKLSFQQIPPQQQQPCVEFRRFGLDPEVDRLRKDKHVLLLELMKLRQQHQVTRAYLQSMELRLQGTEKRQRQMMRFLAKGMQNPQILPLLLKQKGIIIELEQVITKKRRRPVESGPSPDGFNRLCYVKSEPLDYGEHNGFNQVSELEALALEMQGFGRASRVQEEDEQVGELERFWDELLDQGFNEQIEDLVERGGG